MNLSENNPLSIPHRPQPRVEVHHPVINPAIFLASYRMTAFLVADDPIPDLLRRWCLWSPVEDDDDDGPDLDVYHPRFVVDVLLDDNATPALLAHEPNIAVGVAPLTLEGILAVRRKFEAVRPDTHQRVHGHPFYILRLDNMPERLHRIRREFFRWAEDKDLMLSGAVFSVPNWKVPDEWVPLMRTLTSISDGAGRSLLYLDNVGVCRFSSGP